jgi:hypothetical protein
MLHVVARSTTNLFIGHRLAIKVFIGKLPATRGVRVIIESANDKRGHGPIKYLSWSAFDHASHQGLIEPRKRLY